MATVWPADWRAFTNERFCWGETLPNTEWAAMASASPSGSSGRVRASMASPTSSPTSAATWPTVAGLSPERTLMATPCSAK